MTMDPAAAKRIISHMNADHGDSLQTITALSLRLPSLPISAQMTNVDRKGFEVEYKLVQTLHGATKAKKGRINFDKPLESDGEARKALVELSTRSMQIKYPPRFVLPVEFLPALLIWGLLHVLSQASTPDYVPSPLLPLISKVHSVFPPSWAGFLLGSIAIAHALEAVAMFYYTKVVRGADMVTAYQWTFVHFWIGFPTYFAFQKVNPPMPKPKGH